MYGIKMSYKTRREGNMCKKIYEQEVGNGLFIYLKKIQACKTNVASSWHWLNTTLRYYLVCWRKVNNSIRICVSVV